jgi:hypothetical protein
MVQGASTIMDIIMNSIIKRNMPTNMVQDAITATNIRTTIITQLTRM